MSTTDTSTERDDLIVEMVDHLATASHALGTAVATLGNIKARGLDGDFDTASLSKELYAMVQSLNDSIRRSDTER